MHNKKQRIFNRSYSFSDRKMYKTISIFIFNQGLLGGSTSPAVDTQRVHGILHKCFFYYKFKRPYGNNWKVF